MIATPGAFVALAQDNAAMKALQPGFYQVHLHSSAASVIAELADKNNRIGTVRIIPGGQLADVTAIATDGARKTIPGYITQITEALRTDRRQGTVLHRRRALGGREDRRP